MIYPMPDKNPNTKSLIRRLSVVFCQLSVVVVLSGCTAIGFSKPSALQVTTTPEASVFLNGKHLGKTPFYSDQLKVGEYTLKVTESNSDYALKISLTEGTLTVVNRDLNPNFLAQSGENLSLTNGQKGLFVISFPNEADITVDGKYVGISPFLLEDLEEGDHQVLVSKIGYIDREFAIHSSLKYQLLADVTLASQIAKGIGINQTDPKPLKVDHVLIQNTPQGFLRVRREPETDSTELGRVKSGEEYEIIQEIGEWFQISLEGKLGWISKTFSEKVE